MTSADTLLRGLDPEPPSRASKRVDLRLVISVVLFVGLAAFFWLTSRYPALNDKADGAQDFDISGASGFGTLVSVEPNDSLLWRLTGSAINWLWSNWQGMTFGIAFGGVMLTLLSLLKNRSFRSATANSALGVVIGAPLGVCVNCAAPISYGMRRGGARPETALAAMFASPTYNVIVISIGLSLLPGYMVLMKLTVSLVFILAVVPRIARGVPDVGDAAPAIPRFGQRLLGDPLSGSSSNGVPAETTVTDHRFLGSLRWVAVTSLKNVWEIARLAVPLMVLAAVVGSFIVTVLPFEDIIQYLPSERIISIIAALLLVSIAGLVLPTPIAFDVVIAGSLWAAGLPARYVMALYFTLGIYSIYSAFIVGAVFSRRVAWRLVAPLLLLGVACGFIADVYTDYRQNSREQAQVEALLSDLPRAAAPVALPGESAERILAATSSQQSAFEPIEARVAGDVTNVRVEQAAFEPLSAQTAGFTSIAGPDIGLADRPRNHPSYTYLLPYSQLGGVASGDVHGDGWNDLLVTSDTGVVLYANIQGAFQAQEIAGGVLGTEVASIAALIDVDGDHQLDVVAAFVDGRNVVVFNDGGDFSRDAVHELPTHPEPGTYVSALAAGDLDNDGDLDIVAGWWSIHNGTAPNQLWRQGATGDFGVEELPGQPGQTLSLVLTDFTGDGWLDLMVGNDFAEPDLLYRNTGRGSLAEITGPEGFFSHSTRTTMALVAADVNSDQVIDIFAGQITRPSADTPGRVPMQACAERSDATEQAACEQAERLRQAIAATTRERSLVPCLALAGAQAEACIAVALPMSRSYAPPTVCVPLDERFREAAALCRSGGIGDARTLIGGGNSSTSYEPKSTDLASITGANVFMVSGELGYTDQAATQGLDLAGWAWDTSFFDADNDGDLDASIVTGWGQQRQAQSNVFFRNDGNQFDDATSETGFVDYAQTFGSTPVDIDNDGDLDVVTIAGEGAPTVWLNGMGSGDSIMLDLIGPAGTIDAGTQVLVETQGGASMLRVVDVGGGYVSFDTTELHFGTGDATLVDVRVRWSDGRTTVLEELEVGHRYRVVAE